MAGQDVHATISDVIPQLELADGLPACQFINDTTTRLVSEILSSNGDEDGGRRPRTYLLLHYLHLTHFHAAFAGHSDDHLPYVDWTLPERLDDETARQDFLKWQDLVLPQESQLSGSKVNPHMEFKNEHDCRLHSVKVLGHGAWGVVECVKGKTSGKVFARKKFFFKGGNPDIRRILRSFTTELQALKRLHHHHLVTYVGSYEDPSGTSLVMLPVADCDLSTWMQACSGTVEMQHFFGCLASALAFLHREKVRHKDIKPSNILVYKNHVHLSDFGSSLDWKELEKSSTSGNAEAGTRVYAAPESFDHERRGSSSDVFSLGCVFLELATKLCGRGYDDLYQHLKENGSYVIFYGDNEDGIRSWVEELKKSQRTTTELKLLRIILRMLATDKMSRPTATKLADDLTSLGKEFSCNQCRIDKVVRSLEPMDIHVQEPKRRGPALFKAIQQGNAVAFQLLIGITDDLDVKDAKTDEGATLLEYAIKLKHLSIAESCLNHCRARRLSLDTRRALGRAARVGDAHAVELLMRFGADPNATRESDLTWRSPLYSAASWGHEKAVRTIISRGADLNRKERFHGKTALHAAVRGALDTRVLELMLVYHPNVNATDDEGTTPLMDASNRTSPRFARLLLKAGADPNIPNKAGDTPLAHACREDKWVLAAELIENGAYIRQKTKERANTPLHVAAAHGSTNTIRVLLDRRADMEARSFSGTTPLHLAASYGHLRTVELLFERGASMTSRDDQGYTATGSAARKGWVAIVRLLSLTSDGYVNQTINGSTELMHASTRGDLTAVQTLLDAGAEMNARNKEEESALFKAISKKRTQIATILIQRGCEAERKSNEDVTPLILAASLDCMEIGKALIDRGVPLEVQNKDGSTALAVAAFRGNTELVRLLLDAGANTESEDEDGWTPLFKSTRQGHVETTRLLVDRGARIQGPQFSRHLAGRASLSQDDRW